MEDLNDVFDSIALAENTAFEEAYKEGVTQSRKEGFDEGFRLGLGKGLQIGTTIGYYRRVAQVYSLTLTNLDSAPGSFEVEIPSREVEYRRIVSAEEEKLRSFPRARREKLAHALGQLSNLIDEFDFRDPSNPDIFEHLERIEIKYKKVRALLNLKAASPVQSSTSVAF